MPAITKPQRIGSVRRDLMIGGGLLAFFALLMGLLCILPETADVRGAALEADCYSRMHRMADALTSYIERHPDLSAELAKNSASRDPCAFLKSIGYSDECRCALYPERVSLANSPFVWTSDAIAKCVRRRQEKWPPPLCVIMCHDEPCLHRINSMIHTFMLLSDGSVEKYDVDPDKYRAWLDHRFRRGDDSLATFEREVLSKDAGTE